MSDSTLNKRKRAELSTEETAKAIESLSKTTLLQQFPPELRLNVIRNLPTWCSLRIICNDRDPLDPDYFDNRVVRFLVQNQHRESLGVDKQFYREATAELNKVVDPLNIIVTDPLNIIRTTTYSSYKPPETKPPKYHMMLWGVLYNIVFQSLRFKPNHYVTPEGNRAYIRASFPSLRTPSGDVSPILGDAMFNILRPEEKNLLKQLILRFGDYLRWVVNDHKGERFVLLRICETSIRRAYHQIKSASMDWGHLAKVLERRLSKTPLIYVYLKDPGPIKYATDLAMMEDLKSLEGVEDQTPIFGGIVTQEQWEKEWVTSKG
ncbi:hypothetical protein DM02DRAFT_626155 [Periconia macrospinosa]|uniref:Uncharacterized protein n=1 Tax=Periconia macrospinosa TaxID=97972 RepID=A0A2V1DYI2_9PLEO|nr:hypothetical protein DM02DRAFT_626155 [Periconia macrospinosa]